MQAILDGRMGSGLLPRGRDSPFWKRQLIKGTNQVHVGTTEINIAILEKASWVAFTNRNQVNCFVVSRIKNNFGGHFIYNQIFKKE